MSNCPIISGSNRIASFALSATGGTVNMTLDNAKTPWRSRVAKITPTTTTVTISGNSTTAVTASLFAIVGHDLGYARLITIKLYSGQNQSGTLLYNSGAMQSNRGDGTSIGDRSDFWVSFPGVTFSSFSITIAGITTSPFLIQQIWIDNALQLSRGFNSASLSFRLFERPQLLTTSGGSSVPATGQKRVRAFSWVFPAIDEYDRMFLEMLEVAATDQVFFVISMPEGSNREKLLYSMLARITADVVYLTTGKGANTAVTLAFKEA